MFESTLNVLIYTHLCCVLYNNVLLGFGQNKLKLSKKWKSWPWVNNYSYFTACLFLQEITRLTCVFLCLHLEVFNIHITDWFLLFKSPHMKQTQTPVQNVTLYTLTATAEQHTKIIFFREQQKRRKYLPTRQAGRNRG